MGITCDEFTADGDNALGFNVFDQSVDPKVEIIDATKVDLTMFDATDTEIAGIVWPLDMLPYDGARLKYLGVVLAAAEVTVDDRIRAEIEVESSAGNQKFHLRDIPVVEAVPE